MRTLHIGVIGPSAAAVTLCAQARTAGAMLATAGVAVVVGGTDGVSRAAAEGAASSGGTVIGFLTGYARSTVQLPLTVAVPTGIGELSNGLLVRSCDALLSIGGGWGTLMEVALAQRTEVPVVSLDGWVLSDGAGQPIAGPTAAATVDEAVEMVRRAAAQRRSTDEHRIG
ncbi:hypothetical protein EDD30_3523 [Couchioplanes caeruleus]|uniref:TIGR00725 family protein n=2 Tax=Couchioplanes caeruleus TaxID=56438 RepID=A0A3N1GKB5_9ACTN|nr:hypothetical protein EDD30_3523 [Couchioplanes caeruleus]